MVRGLNETLKMLDKFDHDLQEDIKAEIEIGTMAILNEARRLLNQGGNDLETQHGIQHTNTNIDQFLNFEMAEMGLVGIIYIPEEASVLSMYLEFGCGISAAGYVPTLPPEMQMIALKYFINGKGTLIKRPFLIPAYFDGYPKILKAMKAAFEKRGVKVNLIY